MTHHQIQLVQESWDKVKPIASIAGHLFYEKLFTAAPQVRHLFKADISTQADKLVHMLGYIVAKLSRLEELLPEVRRLAMNHNKYGAQPAHYEVVGECLIATLRDGLNGHWNPELEDAWMVAYATLKNVMITAQDEELRAAS